MPLAALAEPHRLEQIAKGVSRVKHGGSRRLCGRQTACGLKRELSRRETVILVGLCHLWQTVSSLRLPADGAYSIYMEENAYGAFDSNGEPAWNNGGLGRSTGFDW